MRSKSPQFSDVAPTWLPVSTQFSGVPLAVFQKRIHLYVAVCGGETEAEDFLHSGPLLGGITVN